MDREKRYEGKTSFILQEIGHEISLNWSKTYDAAIQKIVVMDMKDGGRIKNKVLNVL